ncbi:MAG: ABC transporter ATP-binding protein [Prevotellaceae bacterium]|nr:ABC transporter ATP-binding protein [Candidatus Minthosoma caballi]
MSYILNNIHKSFTDGASNTRSVLQGISATIEQGDFVAITGVSGSGKTTLLNVLGTLLTPDSGEYIINGTNVTLPGVELEEIRNKHIGFVFQDFRLLPQYTAKENILIPLLANASKVTAEQEEYAEFLIKTLGIEHIKNQTPSTLSGGEKARVSICRALINRPSLLLADEPTGQLDAENAEVIASLLQKVNEEFGTTIILVTHDSNIASKAKRTLRLANGNIQ